MLTPYAVASHWPFIRSHLLIRDLPNRPNASLRALRLLAEQQVWSEGLPVPMSAKRLRMLGLTAGEAGNAWAALTELERAAVLSRYRGAGRRPDLWSFAGSLADRWRVPWEWGGREVELVVENCTCLLDVSARCPGQSDMDLVRQGYFVLPAAAHLGFRADLRAENAEHRAETSEPTRANGTFPRGNGRLLHNSPSGRIGGRVERIPSSLEGTDDEALRMLQEAIEGPTGSTLFGAPLDELRAIAANCNGELEALAERLREDATRTRSPVQVARRAGEHLRMIRGEAHKHRRGALDRARQRVSFLRSLPELDEIYTQELADLLATLEADA